MILYVRIPFIRIMHFTVLYIRFFLLNEPYTTHNTQARHARLTTTAGQHPYNILLSKCP